MSFTQDKWGIENMLSTRSSSEEKITEKLLGDDYEEDYSDSEVFATVQRNQMRWKIFGILSTAFLLISLISNAFQLYASNENKRKPSYIYSPAENAIEYEIKVFNSNFGTDKTPYQGPPTDEGDAAWKDLYNEIGINSIEKSEAMRLPNQTVPTNGDPNQYIVGLDVFHQLHCLNHLRKTLYPERYHVFENLTGEDLRISMEHTEHCVDSIRQSLMCNSDISTIYWEWDEKKQRMLANAKTTHVCRKFERIRDWGMEHGLDGWDPTINTLVPS